VSVKHADENSELLGDLCRGRKNKREAKVFLAAGLGGLIKMMGKLGERRFSKKHHLASGERGPEYLYRTTEKVVETPLLAD